MRIGIYARVSTTDQTCDNQLLDLRRYAEQRGWTIVGEFVDRGISGTKDSRPQLDKLMDAARKRKVDAVLVWRFDRFARSVKHLITALEEFRSLGVDFVSYSENVDTSTPAGKVMFTIMAAMAEFERNLIVDRVKAGLRRAVSQGKKLGRPAAEMDEIKARALKAEGRSFKEIAAELGTSSATVWRALQKPARLLVASVRA